MTSARHDLAQLIERARAPAILRSCQRDIDAQRKVVLKDQALRQIKALREALDAAERVLEGL